MHFKSGETGDDDDGDDDDDDNDNDNDSTCIYGWERNIAYMYLAALLSYKKPSPGPTFFLADQQSK